jgi:HEXXH motif-containing protein
MSYDDLPVMDLACPCPNGPGYFAQELVLEHSRQVFSRFVERCRTRSPALNAGLLTLLEAAEPDLSFDTVWHPAFLGALSTGNDEAESLTQRIAALALWLHACGYSGEWQAELPRAVQFHFDRWSFPAADALRVSVDKQVKISLRVDGRWRKLTFHRDDKGWRVRGTVRPLPLLNRPGARWVIWGRDELQLWSLTDISQNIEDRGAELMVPRCEAALSGLETFSPDYFSWVSKVVRFIAPRRVIPDEYPSGSSSSNIAPGLVGVGNHGHPISLAESLVHEASHHYYYIAKRLGPIDDGTDEKWYYNPFLERDRPVDRIVLAYHAFGNILLFCRNAMANGLVGDRYVFTREEVLVEQLRVLEEALHTSTGITPLGHALWQPIYNQLHAGQLNN